MMNQIRVLLEDLQTLLDRYDSEKDFNFSTTTKNAHKYYAKGCVDLKVITDFMIEGTKHLQKLLLAEKAFSDCLAPDTISLKTEPRIPHNMDSEALKSYARTYKYKNSVKDKKSKQQ